jgi:uncharacterized membrane protein
MDFKRFAIISVLLAWCVCLIAFRVQRTGSEYYVFLIWNLFLAGVPLVLSTVLRALIHTRGWRSLQILCFTFWLLFLPNAPYLLTDLQHLQSPTTMPTWYDIAILVSCAGTGLLLGYLSLIDVQQIATRKFGAACGWLIALSSLVLNGFALFLGRFLRWNSWDVLVSPGRFLQIAAALVHPVSHPRAVGVTVVFGISLTLGYVAIRLLLANPAATAE